MSWWHRLHGTEGIESYRQAFRRDDAHIRELMVLETKLSEAIEILNKIHALLVKRLGGGANVGSS
jgi:hypothetical protein